MPSRYQIRKDALRSSIALQVYGPVPERIYAPRSPRSRVVLRQDTRNTAYLIHETHKGQALSAVRVAATAVGLIQSLLEE